MDNCGPKFRDGHNQNDRLEWWLSKSQSYPFHAKSPTSVKSHIVEGTHVSVVLEAGWRTWGFKTDIERDKFCTQFGGYALCPQL